ncbi:MAG: hypothetical protein AAF351_11070 [Pseudomonadota bacterium]
MHQAGFKRSFRGSSWLVRLMVIIALAFSGTAIVAQDRNPEDVEDAIETDTEEELTDAEVPDEDASEDRPEIDEEYYGDVDDEDFLPSEEIPADQSIPFPTDI